MFGCIWQRVYMGQRFIEVVRITELHLSIYAFIFKKNTWLKKRNGSIIFDNDSDLNYSEAISFLKSYVSKELPDFKPEREYYDPHGYWGIFFVAKGNEIFLGSERSFLTYHLIIANKKIKLSEKDERVLKLEATSKKNFIFLLSIMKDSLNKDSSML